MAAPITPPNLELLEDQNPAHLMPVMSNPWHRPEESLGAVHQ